MVFVYSSIVLLVLHSGRRRSRPATKTVATFITFDTLCVGVMIATLTVLARSGLPVSCHRLVHPDNSKFPVSAIDFAVFPC